MVGLKLRVDKPLHKSLHNLSKHLVSSQADHEINSWPFFPVFLTGNNNYIALLYLSANDEDIIPHRYYNLFYSVENRAYFYNHLALPSLVTQALYPIV